MIWGAPHVLLLAACELWDDNFSEFMEHAGWRLVKIKNVCSFECEARTTWSITRGACVSILLCRLPSPLADLKPGEKTEYGCRPGTGETFYRIGHPRVPAVILMPGCKAAKLQSS